MDMVCQEGHFIVDNVSYYKDAKIGTELTAEADWKRRGLYVGPQVCVFYCGCLGSSDDVLCSSILWM